MSIHYHVGVLQMSVLDFGIWKVGDVHYTYVGPSGVFFPAIQSRELVNTTSAKCLDLTTVWVC